MREQAHFSGWRVLAGCFLVMFCVQGGLQSLAVFMPAIAGGLDVHLAEVALISTFATIAAFLANLSIGAVLKKWNVRLVLFFGLVCFSGHYLVFAYTSSLVIIYVGALIGGLAIGYGTIAPVSVVMTNWFIKKRATYMSIIVAGSMFGGAAIMPVAGWLIESWGYRQAYLILAGAGFIVVSFAIFFLIIDTPERKGQKAYGAEEVEARLAAAPGPEADGVTAAHARSSASFWLLLLAVLFIGCSTNIENFLPAFWRSRGMSVAGSSNIMGLYAFIAGLAAMFLGRVTDKLGGVAYGLLTVSMFVIGTILVVVIGSAALPMMLLGLIPFSVGGKKTSIMTPPLVVAESFGRKHYGEVIGYFTAMLQLGIALSNPLIGGLLKSSGDFVLPFYAMAGINGAALILLLLSIKLAPYKKLKPA